MKKLFLLSVVAGLIVTACGPSPAQLEQKRIQDSIKIADSIRVVDSIAAAKAAADTLKADTAKMKAEVKK